DPRRAARIAWLAATATLYVAAVLCFWPLITAQDWLPSTPMFAMLAAPLALKAARGHLGPRLRAASLLPLGVVLVEVLVALAIKPAWRDDARPEALYLSEVLRLTHPGESLMDLKGESIFRSRPFYYALEALTQARLVRGQIRDDIAARLVTSRTTVVSA